MEVILRCLLLLCLVTSITTNQLPVFTKTEYDVCEDIPVGTVAFTLAVTDPEGDRLTFEIRGMDAVYFSVGLDTGTITVKKSIEGLKSSRLKIEANAFDGINKSPKRVTINILKANIYRPIFVESSFDIPVPENTSVGTELFTATAIDEDGPASSAGQINYSIDEVTPSEGRDLFSISGSGQVRLVKHLDYSTQSPIYQLRIKATDGGGKCYFDSINYFSSTILALIAVKDVPNLDPMFYGLPYITSVKENSPIGQSVLTVRALDQDRGINDAIKFSIEDATSAELFKISRDNGAISVNANIDREAIGDEVTLTVKATESKPNIDGVLASATANVRINIIDVNDNKPELYECKDAVDDSSCIKTSHFTVEVPENSRGAVPFNMLVKDPDMISKNELILEGADKDVFSLEPQVAVSDSFVQLLIQQPQNLDFEQKQQMILEVIVKDPKETSFVSTATVTIVILDTNDITPTFKKDVYKLEVAEHAPAGTIVETITAEDNDTMDQGKITYKLLPDSIRQYFDVNPKTGQVFVKDDRLLDREARSLYSATLEARDSGGKVGTAQLEITLTDINDHGPVINRDPYREFVKEDGKLEFQIEASDADEAGTVNSQIVFAILQSTYSKNFTIDPNTGVLRNKGQLDREALDPKLKGTIELTVTATDKADPPKSGTAQVIIVLEDVNDNVPEFRKPSYQFSVKEGEKGAFVGSVQAKDLDQTEVFNRISFNIVNGSFGSFIIRTLEDEQGYSGNIMADPDIELDYESARKDFTLWVEATDLELKKAFVKVEVEVLDVNDERPEFQPADPVEVKENTTYSDPVGAFKALDKDGNHSLVYQLESMKCRCEGSYSPCSWFILEPTGEVIVNPEHTVDYEHCDQVLVEAQVEDERTEKGENNSIATGTLEINIKDINDNAPEFLYSDSLFVVVSETASKGTSVAAVTASDRDSGVNRQIDFTVTGVQFEDMNNITSDTGNLFEAVTTQQKDTYIGIIQTTEPLEMTLKGKYLVSLAATDTGDLSTSTVVEIYTVDETFKVQLQFRISRAEVEKNKDNIVRALTVATKATVEVVAIKPDSSEDTRASSGAIMVAYFLRPKGLALTSSEVLKMISDPAYFPELEQLGLLYIGTTTVTSTEGDLLNFILFGVVGGLVIVLVVLITSLVCTRRNYGRRLKAAKAMNSAVKVVSDNQKSGPVVPGTNKYTMEGANPVLNLNIDTTMVMDFEGESSDVDKVSMTSLDYSDDIIMPEKDTMHVIEEEEEEDEEEFDSPPGYMQALDAALAQQDRRRDSERPSVGFINPAFSTSGL